MHTHPLMQQFLELLGPRACTTTEALARLTRLDQFRAEMFAFWQNYDAILCPACALPAIPHGTSFETWTALRYTMAYNLTGWPGGAGGDVAGWSADWRSDRRPAVVRRRGAGDRRTHRNGFLWLATAAGGQCMPGGMRATSVEELRRAGYSDPAESLRGDAGRYL
jgi:hypothetical protein